MRDPLVFLLGALVGSVAVALLASPGDAARVDVPRSVPSPPETAFHDPVEVPFLPIEGECCELVGRLQEELDVQRFAHTVQMTSVVGTPVLWPADLDPSYGPDHVEALVTEACRPYAGERAVVDCGEFPCIVLLPGHKSLLSCPEWDVDAIRVGTSHDGGRPFTRVVVAPTTWHSGDPQNLELRLQDRLRVLLSQVEDAWFE